MLLAKTATDLIGAGHDPMEAARRAIDVLGRRVGGLGGCILLDHDGRNRLAFNTPRMAYAYRAADGGRGRRHLSRELCARPWLLPDLKRDGTAYAAPCRVRVRDRGRVPTSQRRLRRWNIAQFVICRSTRRPRPSLHFRAEPTFLLAGVQAGLRREPARVRREGADGRQAQVSWSTAPIDEPGPCGARRTALARVL